jgi:hypothetical protein
MTAKEKRLSSGAAIAALAGYELVRLNDGTFVIAKWGLLKTLTDLDAVERFLALVAPRTNSTGHVPHG